MSAQITLRDLCAVIEDRSRAGTATRPALALAMVDALREAVSLLEAMRGPAAKMLDQLDRPSEANALVHRLSQLYLVNVPDGAR